MKQCIRPVSNLLSFLTFLLIASPIYAADGLELGTFKGLGAYEPEVSQDVSSAGNILANILSNVISFLTLVAGIFFMIWFMIGALKWLTAGGKREQVEQAKSSMTNAAIGLIIVAASYAIIFIVGTVLGLDILNIGAMVQKLGPGGGSN